MEKIMVQLLLCCLCMSSCSDIGGDRPALPPDQDATETPDTPQDHTELISKTVSVPPIYGQEAERRGMHCTVREIRSIASSRRVLMLCVKRVWRWKSTNMKVCRTVSDIPMRSGWPALTAG